MSRFTVLRVEVDSDVVERVLGLTPGVEVVEGFDAATEPHTPPADERTPPDDEREQADDAGLLERATPDDELLESGSLLREYGLLGVGASFVMLGLATVGIWWYRRRKGGSETPEPTEFEPPTDTRPTGAGTATTGVEPAAQPSTDEGGTDADDDESLSIRSADDDVAGAGDSGDGGASDETVDEPAGRTDDREDVEWTTKWDSAGPEPADDEADETTATELSDETESVDAAPLLGVAFIALSGALVRWLQGGDQ